jgi:crotonobetainyl-CoA:carnitine CoA-transferase CaiB-like acyl-CoA transferase
MVGGASNQWPLFCTAIDRLDLIDDPRFETGESRTQHYDVLEPVLSEAMRQKTTAAWLVELSKLEIPCGPVNTIPQVAADPQIAAREMIVDVPHPTLGAAKVVSTPIKLSRTPSRPTSPSPTLGEHTDQLLQELLRMSSTELQALRESGAI